MNSLQEEYDTALQEYYEARGAEVRNIQLLRVRYERLIQAAKKLVDSQGGGSR